MLEMVGAIALSFYATAQVGLLIGLADLGPQSKLKAAAAAAAWLVSIVAIYACGGLKPGLLGPIPVNFLPFTILLVGLFGTWLVSPDARRALESIPLPALIAAHSGRIAGIFFFLLYLSDRLSSPFGPLAAFGDIITAGVAALFAGLMFVGVRVQRRSIALWNAFGALDLLVAIALAALSARGTPFQLFRDGPGTEVLATLPWIFAPAILVPIDMFLHFLIAVRLRKSKASATAAHWRREPRLSRA